MQSSGAQSTRNCVSCGRSISWDANVCQYCGHDYRQMVAQAAPSREHESYPLVGGILILLGSLVYLGLGGLVAGGSAVASVGEGVACGMIGLVLGVISLLGGIFAIQKKYFVLALIAGILTVPTILGLIGMILVAVSKDNFTS